MKNKICFTKLNKILKCLQLTLNEKMLYYPTFYILIINLLYLWKTESSMKSLHTLSDIFMYLILLFSNIFTTLLSCFRFTKWVCFYYFYP